MKSRTNNEVLLGYGTFHIDDVSPDKMKDLLAKAYDCNYDYIDTAAYYKNEEIIGEALEMLKQEKGEDFYFPVQTKIWTSDYKNVRQAVLSSLAKLKLKSLDCVLLHRPSTNLAHDIAAWKVLIELQKEGLVKEIGVSNYDYEMLHFFKQATGILPKYNQIEFSLFNSRFDRYVSNLHLGVKVQAWRPLTNDLDRLEKEPIVKELCQKHNTNAIGLALAYLKFFKINPIVKSVNENRIESNAAGFFNVNLSLADAKLLRGLNFYLIAGSSTYPFAAELSEEFSKEIEEAFVKSNQ